MSSGKAGEIIQKACIVPICKDKKFNLVHKFPSDHERFREWFNAIQKTTPIPQLAGLTEDAIRKRYFVCCRHFGFNQYKNSQSRSLNVTAIPHLNIDNLDELFKSKAWEIDRAPDVVVTIQTTSPKKPPVSPKPIKILNKDANNPREIPTEKLLQKIQSNITVNTSLAAVKRKAMLKIEQPAKRTKTTDDLEIETIPMTEFECDIAPLNNIKETVKIVPVMSETVKIVTTTEVPVVEDEKVEKSQNKLLALFDVTPEQYEYLKKSLDSGKNIVSLINIDKEGDDLDSSSTDTDSVEIIIEDRPLKFDLFWLRDHCRCDTCYDHVNHQRKLNLADIPDDISTKDLKSFAKKDEKSFEFIWTDGHKSIYENDFLVKFRHENLPSIMNEKILWNKESSEQFLTSSHVTMRDYMTDNEVSKKVLESLHKYGLAFIDGVQSTKQNTEFVICELFPVQKTLFGEMWTFSDVKDHSDTAYTNIYLGSHTDNTYFNDAAGLQILHCIQHTGTGGENFLVDGFAVAMKLKEEHPEVFNRLTEYIVPAEYIEDGRHHSYYAPIIKLHPSTKEIEQIRFNLYDRAPMTTLNGKDLRQFYKDVKILAKEMENAENRIVFKLNPGTVLIFDNWRVLHGREKYTGKRVMCGCYVARTEYQSALRVNKIID